MKKAIAMKCSQKDWDSIKEKFDIEQINSITSFLKYPYLTNAESNKIDNIDRTTTWITWREKELQIHETFNAKIFLNACGIDCDVYEITKLQARYIEKQLNGTAKDQFREWFPDAFEKPFTGWAKSTGRGNEKWIAYFENDMFKYGIGADGKWFESENTCHVFKFSDNYDNIEATPKEVESALINEAKKRGFKDGIYCNNSEIHGTKLHNNKLGNGYLKLEENCLNWYECDETWYCIFKDGKWATIIETITIQEAEKLLNKKIV